MLNRPIFRWCRVLFGAASMALAQDKPEAFPVEGHTAYLQAAPTAAPKLRSAFAAPSDKVQVRPDNMS